MFDLDQSATIRGKEGRTKRNSMVLDELHGWHVSVSFVLLVPRASGHILRAMALNPFFLKVFMCSFSAVMDLPVALAASCLNHVFFNSLRGLRRQLRPYYIRCGSHTQK